MSEAYKCDACGTFNEPPMGGKFLPIFDSKGRWEGGENLEGANDEGEKELCPDCAAEVGNLLESIDESSGDASGSEA